MTFIGIMEGRLVPPVDQRIQAFPRERWADEFPLARQAGLDGIEWIYDTWGLGANPLETAEGVARLRALSAEQGVSVRSVCADYFMDFPLLRAAPDELERRRRHLEWLIGQCQLAGMRRMVVPFVDNSAIQTEAEMDGVVAVLQKTLPAAEACGVELHLETALAPQPFAALMARINHPYLRVNYDSGNSAALGYAPREEFAAYGRWVGSVHIKDRKRGGGTVPLGTGDTDLPAVFDSLRQERYAGDFILQVARGESGAEVAWSRQNRAFVLNYTALWTLD